jgi:hypothetical protein
MLVRALSLCVLLLPAAAPAQQAASSARDPAAMKILTAMAEHLAKSPKFSVNIRSGFDVVQASGQKIEFGETRTVTIRRPDRFRSDIVGDDGDKGLVVFNGKEIFVLNASENFYALESMPGTLDQAILRLISELKVRVPLGLMYVSTLPAELEQRVREAAVVDQVIDGKTVLDHLAVRTDTVDFQVWVPQGKDPLPSRIVLTYKLEDGQPQYWADLSGWNFSPDVAEAKFTFTPPAGAVRIQFQNQVTTPAGDAGKAEATQ